MACPQAAAGAMFQGLITIALLFTHKWIASSGFTSANENPVSPCRKSQEKYLRSYCPSSQTFGCCPEQFEFKRSCLSSIVPLPRYGSLGKRLESGNSGLFHLTGISADTHPFHPLWLMALA